MKQVGANSLIVLSIKRTNHTNIKFSGRQGAKIKTSNGCSSAIVDNYILMVFGINVIEKKIYLSLT